MTRGALLLLTSVVLVATLKEVSGDGPAKKLQYPNGFWFGTQMLACVFKEKKKYKRSTSWVYVHDFVHHTLVYFRGRYHEWGPNGSKAETSPMTTDCPITWRRSPAGTSLCSSDSAIQFVRHYKTNYGRYHVFFNNCHHFANRLKTMLQMSDCPPEGTRGGGADWVRFTRFIDNVRRFFGGIARDLKRLPPIKKLIIPELSMVKQSC